MGSRPISGLYLTFLIMNNLKNFVFSNRHFSLQKESSVFVSDNSGVRLGKCIDIKLKSKTKGAIPANLLKISVKKIKNNKKFKKGDICRAILIRRKRS